VAWALADERLEFEHTCFEPDEPYVDESGVTHNEVGGPLASRRTTSGSAASVRRSAA